MSSHQESGTAPASLLRADQKVSHRSAMTEEGEDSSGAGASSSMLAAPRSLEGPARQVAPRPSVSSLTFHPSPSTLHPPPSTLQPPPSTLHPQPSTLNPQPGNPEPRTPNPKEKRRDVGHSAAKKGDATPDKTPPSVHRVTPKFLATFIPDENTTSIAGSLESIPKANPSPEPWTSTPKP